MRKIFLFICVALLCGCYRPLYVNKPYTPINPNDVVLKIREDSDWKFRQIEQHNLCENPEQIAYIHDGKFYPLFFSNPQGVIDNVRTQTASLGGNYGVVYNRTNLWLLLFGINGADSIVYKCPTLPKRKDVW